MTELRTRPQWQQLEAHAAQLRRRSLRELFAEDPGRGARMAAEAAGLYLDFSKNLVTDETLRLLVDLAEACGLRDRTEAMFTGAHINTSEDRAVLHTALRMPRDTRLVVDGQDVVADVHEVLDRMRDFAGRVRSGAWTGHTGKRVRNVVNIGIGGSDLGPKMAYEALRHYSQRDLTFRFVSNIDGSDFVEATRDLDPAETLFIVASKTFGTAETLTNATTARRWLLAALGDEAAVASHFVAVSTNAERVAAFGIDTANMFGFWDWVGGRYSFPSAIGLSLMIAIGPEHYDAMLGGFAAMDAHFRSAPYEQNLPALLGLLTVWYVNFFDVQSIAVLPYDQYLALLPAYLQQLEMESSGKHVTAGGQRVDYATGPVIWGQPGTNGQHAYHQLLHQGTVLVPAHLLGGLRPLTDLGEHHDMLIANLLAQAQAFAFGRSTDDLRAAGVAEAEIPHRQMDGNRPSTTVLYDQLTPAVLGALVALYEHSVFVQGTVWDIDSYDQWGVELGKILAVDLVPQLSGEAAPAATNDSSTDALARRYRAANGRP